MTYKDELARAMAYLGEDDRTIFVGYNVRCGGQANGTLKTIPEAQLLETPVAENLMVGLATGMALAGRKPVVYIERFDFILNALDAIVNHLDKVELLSDSEYSPKIILRVLVGGQLNPLFTGPTHTQDFSEALRKLVNFPVVQLFDVRFVVEQYQKAYFNLSRYSTMLVEYRDLYGQAHA